MLLLIVSEEVLMELFKLEEAGDTDSVVVMVDVELFGGVAAFVDAGRNKGDLAVKTADARILER